MADLFAGLEALSFRRRSRRQAAVDATLIQESVIGSKTRPKRRNKCPAASGSSSGKPRTGGRPRTGFGPIDASLDDEWEKRRPVQAGGGGGGAAPSRTGSGARPKVAGGASPPAARPDADNLNARVRVASGSQAAVVKIASYAAGGSRVRALVQYQSRSGELPLEREDGSKIAGAEELAALATEWTNAEPEREPTKDVLRLTLTIEGEHFRGRAGLSAIEAGLRHALPGHRFAFATEDKADGTTHVDLVMSAAARRQGEAAKATRIFDNRKSLSQLGTSLDRSFGTDTDLDVRGFAHGVEGTARYLTQLTRGGTKAVQSMRLSKDGSFAASATLIGHDANLKEARAWKRDLRSQEQRDVAHIILSARPGTDKEAFVEAARAMLAREFAGHKYAFALHEDRQHIHIHAVVKMKAETGERLDPKIQDLSRWRETLAHEARERHIPMEALSRFERANPPGYKLKDIRRVERGIAPDNVRRRVDAVRDRAVHVPVREEGKRRANAALQGWREVEAITAKHSLEPVLAAGATRLYRADRPGAALTSAPLFTRDREAATRMAERTGGSVSYIDVSPSQLSALKPSRTDAVNQFVVSPELAAHRKPLHQPATAAILEFKDRATKAVAGAAHRATSRLIDTTGESNDMANLQTMKATFDDMNSQLNVVEQNLPADKLPELAEVRKKIKANQRDMIAAQENIERKRGSVEGDKYVEPKRQELGNFVSDKRGETIRYSRLREDGEIGKTAFVDTGKKVEIHDWKDRQAVLAAMQVSAEKWRSLTVTGTNSYNALVVELVAEHGFHIANPELQEKIKRETARRDRVRAEGPGFVAGPVEKPAVPTEGDPHVQPVARILDKTELVDRSHVETPAAVGAEQRWAVTRQHFATGMDTVVLVTNSAAEADKAFQSGHENNGIKDNRTGESVAFVEWTNDGSTPVHRYVGKEFKAALEAEKSGKGQKPLRTPSEISLALDTVRIRTENEAVRETRQADTSTQTYEKPFDGGGSDHAYRTQSEAGAARRAENAVALDPKRPMPADINQSPQVERLAQDQTELLKEKREIEKIETLKEVHRQKQ